MSYSIRQPDDGTFHITNGNDAIDDLHVGGPASPTSASPRFIGPRVMKIALLAGVDTAGAVLSWQNPNNYAIVIDRLVIDVTTVASAACTLSAGQTATNGTTSSANLIDTLDVRSAVGTFDNITDKGTNGKSRQKIAVGKWLTISTASGASAGLVANAYVTYYPAT